MGEKEALKDTMSTLTAHMFHIFFPSFLQVVTVRYRSGKVIGCLETFSK